jgi:two-component system, response regulator
MYTRRLPIVLVAEDDLGDRALLQEAFQACGASVDLRFVTNGEELLGYLYRRPPWEKVERPDLVLLDLNMPQMGGLDALRRVKAHPDLRSIPGVVLTTSRAEEDIADAYAQGASIYIVKPGSLDELVGVVRVLCDFWFKIGSLPRAAEEAERDTDFK